MCRRYRPDTKVQDWSTIKEQFGELKAREEALGSTLRQLGEMVPPQ
jgi:hypothetical protein